MKLKPSKQLLILLGAAVGAAVLLFGGVFWFQSTALDETMQKLEARQKELEDGKKIAEREELAKAMLEEDLTQLRFLESGVSEAVYVPTFLKQLEELAGETKNRVLGIRPEVVRQAPTKLQQRRDPEADEKAQKDGKKPAAEKPEPYTRLSIEVNLEGTFQSAQTFISRLTRFPKIVAVEEVQLQPQQAQLNTAAGALSARVKLIAFVMKETQPARASVTASSVSALQQAELGGSR
ncbi:MAG: type 4a pilus biogenesis protein PilO [Armatimonadota bacterium]